MKEQTDEIIMAMVAKGNLDLLKILFKRHHLHVYNFLYKMCRDKMLSEDVTQEVFYNIMRYRASYKNGKFVSWMFTIARNSLRKHLKKAQVYHEDLDDISYRLIENEEPKEDYTHLQKALDKLNSTDKELLVLNRFQEIKYAELANIVGSTEGAVKTKVSRALKKLKVIYFENL